MQRAGAPVAEGFLAGGFFVDGFEGQGDFDQFFYGRAFDLQYVFSYRKACRFPYISSLAVADGVGLNCFASSQASLN